jgi:hypothetical protein
MRSLLIPFVFFVRACVDLSPVQLPGKIQRRNVAAYFLALPNQPPIISKL